MAIITNVEELEKFHEKHDLEPLDKKAKQAHKKAFGKGAMSYTLDEVKKGGKLADVIVRPLVLLNVTAMQSLEWVKVSTISKKPLIGWKGLTKPKYTYHWSADNRNAPWDFIWQMYDWTLALDFKKPNETRIPMANKWGEPVGPSWKQKIKKARAANMVPALTWPDYELLQEDKDKALQNPWVYPLTEDGYITSLDSDPYRPKLRRMASHPDNLPVFKSLGCWEQWQEEYEQLSKQDRAWLKKEFGYIPPDEMERKPLIIHWEKWRR